MHMDGQGLFYLSSEWGGVGGGSGFFNFFSIMFYNIKLGFYVGEYPMFQNALQMGKSNGSFSKNKFRKNMRPPLWRLKKLIINIPRSKIHI